MSGAVVCFSDCSYCLLMGGIHSGAEYRVQPCKKKRWGTANTGGASVHSGACEAPNFLGPGEESPHCTAPQGRAGRSIAIPVRGPAPSGGPFFCRDLRCRPCFLRPALTSGVN